MDINVDMCGRECEACHGCNDTKHGYGNDDQMDLNSTDGYSEEFQERSARYYIGVKLEPVNWSEYK
jgi:hypothetical protein